MTDRLNRRQNSILKASISKAIKDSELDRFAIASGISRITGRTLTKPMLDAYTSKSKQDHRIPIDVFAALCQIIGGRELLQTLVGLFNYRVIDADEAEILDIAKLELKKEDLERRIREKKLKMGV